MKKTIKYGFFALCLLIILLAIAPFIFKDKIIQAAKDFANKQLVATVNFDANESSVSFLRSFPQVSLTVANASVVGKDSFEGDTLIFAPELGLNFDFKSIFGTELAVKKLSLNNANIRIKVLRSGNPNWKIWKDQPTSTADTGNTYFVAKLNKIEIENCNLDYTDYSLGFSTQMQNWNHTASGDFSADNFTLSNKLEVDKLTLSYGGVTWLNQVNAKTSADIGMDIPNMKFDWNSNDIAVNDLKLHSNGWVKLNENDIDMDFKFNALQNTFKSFLSLVPGIYSNNFKDLKANGTMSLNGSMVGKLTDNYLPKTDIKLLVNNGSFSYPSMPQSVSGVSIDARYVNSNGLPDNTIVQVDKLNATIAGNPIQAKLIYKTPQSNPYIDAEAKGKLDLGIIKSIVPLDKGTSLSGLVDADLKAKGNFSSLTGNYEKANAQGYLKCNNINYNSADMAQPTELKTIDITINPANAQINNAVGKLGKNDFEINGTVQNYLAHLFRGETLTGTMDFKSNYFNVNDFMSDETAPEPKPTDTNNIEIVVLPENIDWKLKADVKKLIYDNYILDDLSGNLHLQQAAIDFSKVSAQLAGGTVLLDGKYDSKNISNPFTELKSQIQNFEFGNSFKYFSFLQKFSNLAGFVNGIFDARIDMNSILDQYMQPNYNSMNVDAELKLKNTFVKNLDVLKKAGELLKINWLSNLELKDKVLRLQIKNGVLKMLDSLNFNLGKGVNMRLSGESHLNKTILYGGKMYIPRELFGKGNSVLEKWIAIAKTKNWNLEVEKIIPVDISIGGTFLKPEVKVNLQSFKNSVVAPLKEQVINKAKDEGQKKIDQALALAQTQADKLKAEAKRRADQLRAAGKKTADSLRNVAASKAALLRAEAQEKADLLKAEGAKKKQEVLDKAIAEIEVLKNKADAEGPLAKLAAQKAADKLKAEADKKAQQIQNEYDAKVDASNKVANDNISKVQNEVNARAQQIETEANDKGAKIEQVANTRADQIMTEARNKTKIN